MKALPLDWWDMFPGGVPGWVIFGTQVHDIRLRLSRCCKDPTGNPNETDLAELCYIGLIAYFEGFVRYHFASCVNVCPKLLYGFARARPDTVIALLDIAEMDTVHGKIGFLLVDNLAFTTPKEINGQYQSLLNVTPFGKNETFEYNRILHDRHQIVHSAGMYTMKYLRINSGGQSSNSDRAYGDSIVIVPTRVMEVAEFLLSLAEKLVKATYDCLLNPANWRSEEEMESMTEHIGFFKWTTAAFAQETS